MAQKGIIKNTTAAEISAENLAAVFHAIVGKSGIVKSFNDLACTKISDNSVQLASGVYSLKGFMLHVEAGTAITLPVDSGTAGQNRNDLLVAELVKNGGGTGIDTLQFKVVKGTSTSGTPVDPTLTQQDVNATGTTRQEALYRIKLTGVTINVIETVTTLIDNADTITDKLVIETGGNAAVGYYRKYGNGDIEFWGQIDLNGTFNTGSTAIFERGWPVACTTVPVITMTVSMYNGKGNYNDYRATAHLSDATTGNFYGHVHCSYTVSTQYYMGLHYHAKAKWK